MWITGTTGLIRRMKPYQVEEELGTTDLSFSPGLIFNSQLDVEPLKTCM